MLRMDQIQECVDRFVADLIDVVRTQSLNSLSTAFGPSTSEPKTRKQKKSEPKQREKKSKPVLSGRLAQAYNLILTKHGSTSANLALMLKCSESATRHLLAQLSQQGLITNSLLGDGSRRKAYFKT